MADHIAPPPILDERLARLGREWFADIRRRTREDPPKPKADGRDEGDGFLDLLFGDGDGDTADGGDS